MFQGFAHLESLALILHSRVHWCTCRAVWLVYFPNFSSSFGKMKVRGQIRRSNFPLFKFPQPRNAGFWLLPLPLGYQSPSVALWVAFCSDLKVQRQIECQFFITDMRVLELDTFSKEVDVMWRGFVISVIAAVSLQYIDPFGTKKLVLFGVSMT